MLGTLALDEPLDSEDGTHLALLNFYLSLDAREWVEERVQTIRAREVYRGRSFFPHPAEG